MNTLLARAIWQKLREEDGQAATEYALFTFFVIFGLSFGLGGFLPAMFKAYEHYVHGFWMVLSLPVP
ncbi:MAG TPA: hypothetical protein VGK67_22545 [Myxococcales bacterium]|jgi:Flp pilus assembly pilin Flp